MRMFSRSVGSRVLALALCALTVTATAPFSLAETLLTSPLGSVFTAGRVTIGGSVAPTGTTIFAGDRVSTLESPALINLATGSRIEMAKALATFNREGQTLVVKATTGLLRFNFKKGEAVRLHAGRYTLETV